MDVGVDCNERLEFIRQQRLQTLKTIQSLKAEYYQVNKKLEDAGIPFDSDLMDSRKSIGRKMFNSNYKKGLEFLFENHVLDRCPIAVAKFFVDDKLLLSKTAIGKFLGEISREFNMQVLDEFLKLQAFGGTEFLPALRKFLLTFQLPGESQKINKIVSSFANIYVAQNPGVFRSAHEAYVMAYAVILLNTTLHNSNAKHQSLKLAEEKTFVRTMLSFDDDTHLSEEIIRKVYHGIKNQPIQVVAEDSEPCIIQGWLWKLGGRVKSWKRRWFVLTEEKLAYYAAPERASRKGVIGLENVSIRRINDRSKEFSFELFCRRDQFISASKSDRDGSVIIGHHTTYRMAASGPDEYDKWVTSLQSITDRFFNRRGASVPNFPVRNGDTLISTTSSDASINSNCQNGNKNVILNQNSFSSHSSNSASPFPVSTNLNSHNNQSTNDHPC